MSFHDLRGYLDRLERDQQLWRVRTPVDPHLESTALCLRALHEGGPALLMEQAVGARHALLGNLFGQRRLIELALAGRPLASLRELGQLLTAIKEPRWPSSLRDALASGRNWRSSRTSRPSACARRRSNTKPRLATISILRACRSSSAGPAMPAS